MSQERRDEIMIQFLEDKIQKMKKTANNLQHMINSGSAELSSDQKNGLTSLKSSTVNAINESKRELNMLKDQRRKSKKANYSK